MAQHAPRVYSIAAHRGFADALVAGLVPRYAEAGFGLARLTLLLPSARAVRTMQEAFIRYYGAKGEAGLLLPRMAVVGDLDLVDNLGPLLDTLPAGLDIPAAADPVGRWLKLAQFLREEMGDDAPGDAALLRLAFQAGQTMDRLLVEEVAPERLAHPDTLELLGNLAEHWLKSLRVFLKIQDRWRSELERRGQVDVATRRNLLFRSAAQRLREKPPDRPLVAAGVTSAAPALAALLRAVADLPNGAVILPDLDPFLSQEAWDELGRAGASDGHEGPFGRDDALTHPQYHLKLLLNRMGVARAEVQPWHRAGLGKGPPERSRAISSLFLPPQASRCWAGLTADKRCLSGVELIESAHPEEEAQAIALLVREALEQSERRVAVITPDRGLAARVVQHLERWQIKADDSAGRPLAQTAAGRLLLLLAEVLAERAAPVPLMALLNHPLVRRGDRRESWLKAVRRFDLALRGPRPESGLAPLRAIAGKAGVASWWQEVEATLAPLFDPGAQSFLSERLGLLGSVGEALCGDALWAQEDGRALSKVVESLRLQASEVPTPVADGQLPKVLRDVMDREAVRPPYGGHPRVAIYGLLESRMTRADLVICAGLNEGTWPASPPADPLLAPAILRELGVPGADFRIGLSAHDLAGAMGAPRVILSRARRDATGPVVASRFWLRVCALLGDNLPRDLSLARPVQMARAIGIGEQVPPHSRPSPQPTPAQRRTGAVSVTALDRLRSDPYQFYAQKVLRLSELDLLDVTPTAAWQGTLAHAILKDWHDGKGAMADLAEIHLAEMRAHPVMRAMWKPRLLKALAWVEKEVARDPDRIPVVWEEQGHITWRGITITGTADRIDRLADGTLAIVDYKTGTPPSKDQVAKGFAMQLGTLALMAKAGAWTKASGTPTRFEYWSLGKSDKSETGFGYRETPLKVDGARKGLLPEEFLPTAEYYLNEAIDRWILGNEGFTARLNPDAKVYTTYDHLMRLLEWLGREEDEA